MENSDTPDLAAIQAREAAATPIARGKAAYDLVSAISEGKREWTMSIPARDSDPDLVIGGAILALLGEVSRLTSALATAREEACRAVCPECRDGEFHRVTKGGQHANGFVCLGNPIRALLASNASPAGTLRRTT